MSTADHTAIVLRYIEEVLNTGDQEAVATFIDPTYVRHDPGLPFAVQGTDGIRQLMGRFALPSPTSTWPARRVIADGDQVAVYLTGDRHQPRRTHGHAAYRQVDQHGAIEIYRVAGDKIVEQWVVADNAAMLRQLGIAA